MSTSSSLKSIFEEQVNLQVTPRLVKAIHDFERGFANYDEDHIAFFGGHTMGVHKMRFRVTDRENWFTDVMQMDDVVLDDAIEDLPTIKAEWARASDSMNLSSAYLIHFIRNSHLLTQAQRQEACVQVAQVMMYKFLGSLMAHYYPYATSEETMNAMYAALSKKYVLKRAGSWGKLLRERAEELVSVSSVHRRVFDKFDDDEAVVRMVNDTQARLRQIVKSMTEVFYEVRSRGVKIGTERNVLDIDGETVLLDKSKRYTTYIRYLHDVIGDRNSFVRQELVKVITDIMHTMPPRMFNETLAWMSSNHQTPAGKDVAKLIDETLIFAFDLMATNRATLGKQKGLSPLLTRLRSLYMASLMADKNLLECKAMAESIVVKATGSKSNSTVASVRTGIQLYVVLRSMAMNYYQS